MSKKIIVSIFVLLIILVIVLFFIFSKNSVSDNSVDNTTASTTTNTSTGAVKSTPKVPSSSYLNKEGFYVIQYTNNGFVPKNIQIPKGKSVKFINMSSRGMRIFTSRDSDQKFVELNQSTTVSKGSTYTLSIPNGGLWSYYNQTYPTHSATILVY